jgi:hypothetical protein
LDLLGFIRPNRDFSKGCGQKNKKKSTRVSGCVQIVSSRSILSFFIARRRLRTIREAQSGE